jgi:hypothetical protein
LQEIASNFSKTQERVDFVVNRSGRSSLLWCAQDRQITESTAVGPGYQRWTGKTLRLEAGCAVNLVEHLLELSEDSPTFQDLETCRSLRGMFAEVGVGPVLLSVSEPCRPVGADRTVMHPVARFVASAKVSTRRGEWAALGQALSLQHPLHPLLATWRATSSARRPICATIRGIAG